MTKLLSRGNCFKNLNFFWLAALAVVASLPARGQVSAYSFAQDNTNSYQALGTPVLLNVGGGSNRERLYELDMATFGTPMTFVFNGQSYSKLYVASNGFVFFETGDVPASCFITDGYQERFPLSSATATYEGAISVLGKENAYIAVANRVAYEVTGSVGSRILTIDWNLRRPGDTQNFACQLKLHEGTNVIEMRYGFMNALFGTIPQQAEIGLRGKNNSPADIQSLSDTGIWPTAAPGFTINNTATNSVQILRNAIAGTSYRRFIWTPSTCQAPPFANVGTGVNTALVSVTAPVQTPVVAAQPYFYEVRTSGLPGTAGAVATGGIAAAPGSEVLVTGLTPGTTYSLYVRTDCTPDNWSSATVFTTQCASVPVPYWQYFDAVAPPTLEACNTVTQNGTGNVWGTANATGGAAGSIINSFTDEHLVYVKHNSNAANSFYFTQGVQMNTGTIYRISYMYGGSHETNLIINKMKVTLSEVASAAGTVTALGNGGTVLKDHSVIMDSPIRETFNYTATATGPFHLGFQAYSAADMGNLYLDEILFEEETCFAPTGITTTVAPLPGGTNAATINFPAAPSGGYEYYLSTFPTPPGYDAVATGIVPAGNNTLNLTGLAQGTTYYIWIRTNCGFRNSMWSDSITGTPAYDPVTFTTNAPATPVEINMTTNSLVTTGCGVSGGGYAFNDEGGPTGNYYTNNAVREYRFTAGPGYTLRAEFVSFQTENNYDSLSIYNGINSTTGTLIPSGLPAGPFAPVTCPTNSFYGTNSPGVIFSTGPSLTFRWLTDGSVFSAGWRCIITCVAMPNVTGYSPDNNNCGSPAPIVITGTGFNSPAVSEVTINNAPAAFTVNGAGTQITVTPPGNVSTGQLVVRNTTGGAAIVGTYTVNLPAPTTTGVTICTGETDPYFLVNDTPCGGLRIPTPPNVLTGEWTTSSATVNRLAGFTTNSPVCAFDAVTRRVDEINFQVSLTGVYTLRMTDSNGNDGMGYIKTSAGTPATCTGYVIGDDDSNGALNPRMIVNLTAGVSYTLYSTTYGATILGDYTWTITPPTGGNVLIELPATTQWYTAAIGGTLLHTGDTFNPVGVDPSLPDTSAPGIYTYYAACSDNTTCRTATDFVIESAATAVISPASGSICPNAAVQLSVTGSSTTTVWSASVPGTLFTDAAATVPYDGVSSVASVYIKTATNVDVTVNGSIGASSCTVVSTVNYTSTVKTWNGTAWVPAGAPTLADGIVFAGDYNVAANVSGCSCTVNNGADVIIPGTYTMTLENALTVNAGGTITFNDEASLLQISDDAVNSGGITYIRSSTAMNAFDYTYWSTPVSPQTLVAVSPATLSDKYFTHDNASNTYQLIPANSLMEEGKGYLIRAPQPGVVVPPYAAWTAGTPFVAQFKGSLLNNGVPNNGHYDIPIHKNGSNLLNLIGNPYPSAIDADLLMDPSGPNAGIVGGTIYLWTHFTPINGSGQYIASDYAVYNLNGGVGTQPAAGSSVTPNGFIASGQGFFINAVATNPNGVINATINNSMRVAGQNDQFFRAAQAGVEKNRLWLDMTNANGAFKQTLVGYLTNATNNKDLYYDSDVVEAGNTISLYSVNLEDKFAIQGRALPFDMNDQVPLGYRSNTEGPFAISLSNYDGLFGGQDVYLEDTYLNVIHDLKQSAYSFTTTAGTFEDRFILRYTTQALSVADADFGHSAIVYKSDAHTLNVATGMMDMKKVAIYDVRGRLLIGKDNINATEVKFEQLPFANQVLLVQITSADGITVTKKIGF